MSAVAQSVDQGLPPLFPNGSPIANPQAESPIAIRHSDLDMTIIRGSRDSFGSIGINDNDSTFPSSAELQSDPILTNFGQPKFNDDHLAHDSPVANLDNNNGSIFNDNMNKLEHFAASDDGKVSTSGMTNDSDFRTSRDFPSWADSDCWCPAAVHYDHSDDEDEDMEMGGELDFDEMPMERNSLTMPSQQQQQQMQQLQMQQQPMQQQEQIQHHQQPHGSKLRSMSTGSRRTISVPPKAVRRKSVAAGEAKGFWAACCGYGGGKRKGSPPPPPYATRSTSRRKKHNSAMDIDDDEL
jgi:hypothetical protein|tara:strand:- start:314 stop:1201 length:888 start_codon:yes stop_codon:yes gene_type:complete